MKSIKGKAISDGVAFGKIFVHEEKKIIISSKKTAEVKKELQRFSDARREVRKQLEKIANEVDSEIIESHISMVDDVLFGEMVEKYIYKNATADCAVLLVRNELCRTFELMEDEYLKERSLDVKDVSDRIIKELAGVKTDIELEEPGIIMTYELTPSKTVNLNREYALGFITEKGGVNSHTAILAREYGIPAVSGIKFDDSIDGKNVLIDGYAGMIYIEPDEELVNELNEKYSVEDTKDYSKHSGKMPKIYANIADAEGAAAALKAGAEGIGLFRTEFLYLGKKVPPTEDEQFEVYKEVAKLLGDKPVIIRTADIGSDKKVSYLGLEDEKNAALGCRGIRVSLDRVDIFKTQLRAIYRASAFGNIRIMFPMITTVDEVKKIKKLITEVKKELKQEKIEAGKVRLGVMIETPAAAIISDELAKEVDFFSIGTNDLTQYTLAVDRMNENLTDRYNPLHKAIIRLMEITINNAHEAGIEVGMCGELAADKNFISKLPQLNLDEVSVAVPDIKKLKRKKL